MGIILLGVRFRIRTARDYPYQLFLLAAVEEVIADRFHVLREKHIVLTACVSVSFLSIL